MTKKRKGNSESKKKLVPMIVTPETIRAYGINKEDVVKRRIGDRLYQVIMVDSTEAVYAAYVNPEVAEQKKQEREGRCMVRGKNGKLIRCPESNNCRNCERDSEVTHEMNKPASVECLSELGMEPEMAGSLEDDIITKVFFEEMLQMLSEVKQDYDKIFEMHYDGMTQKDIADELGGDYTQRKISDAIKEIQEILKPYAEEFFEK